MHWQCSKHDLLLTSSMLAIPTLLQWGVPCSHRPAYSICYIQACPGLHTTNCPTTNEGSLLHPTDTLRALGYAYI